MPPRQFFPEGASFGLVDQLAERFEREEGKAGKDRARRLATYRAWLTVQAEVFDVADDSYGQLGDLFREAFEGYCGLSWERTGISPETYYRDLAEFVAWDDTAITDEGEQVFGRAIAPAHRGLVESILSDLQAEFAANHLGYKTERAASLLARVLGR